MLPPPPLAHPPASASRPQRHLTYRVGMPNRLADALSPYLRQHADNPVDWWPWCPEAFEEARKRDLPILLSVGYASCHWCHVMAHESFEDPQIAGVMNTAFINIKVDREELPGVDSVYMTATQALTGRGGWPMTVVMTADGEPFYAGTYFPKQQFLTLLTQLAEAWAGSREEVNASASRITTALREYQGTTPTTSGIDAPTLHEQLAAAEEAIADEIDWEKGGFTGAPKFPPSMILDWLLRHHDRTGTPRALHAIEVTTEAMARGGIFDQLAGGFSRYSVDEDWAVPHFEKMLYDNAQLLSIYARLAEKTHSPLATRITTATAEFMLNELRNAQGAFVSSLDADTTLPGGGTFEGFTYIWTPAALKAVLDDDGPRAAELLSVTEKGTFENGTSTLQLHNDPDDTTWWEQTRQRLLDARRLRPQPARDDKVIASWNGLAITGLVDAARSLQRPDLITAAERAAEAILTTHVEGLDHPVRVSLDGNRSDAPATSDDLGNLATGLLHLYSATQEQRWADAARLLLDEAIAHYSDGHGGFVDIPDHCPQLVITPQTSGDNAEPCGQSALAGALVTYGTQFNEPTYREAGIAAVAAGLNLAETQPRFAGHYLAVAEEIHRDHSNA